MHLFGSVFTLDASEPRLHIVVDKKNPKAVALSKKFLKLASKEPNLILVCGGDGFMLDAMHREWKMRLPFLGVNAGHKGFLLNDPQVFKNGIPGELKIYDLPLLDVEVRLTSGKMKRMVAFNDVWVERANSQASWIEVKVNGVVRVPKLVCDGALLATPAGSTAYARSMGAYAVPLDAQTLILTGSNVFDPFVFDPCYLPLWSTVELKTLESNKRPIFGMVDGIKMGKILSIKATVSRTANIQLANVGDQGLPEKLLSIQFPK